MGFNAGDFGKLGLRKSLALCTEFESTLCSVTGLAVHEVVGPPCCDSSDEKRYRSG